MKERKYKKDYRIVNDVDPATGRARDRVEDVGPRYSFADGFPRGAFRAAAVGCAVYWLSALGYLKLARVTANCLYALMPMILSLLPAAYQLMGLFALGRAPKRMTRVERENGAGRLVRAGIGVLILAGIGAAGCAVRVSNAGAWTTAWYEPLLAACAAAGASLAFGNARKIERKLGQ